MALVGGAIVSQFITVYITPAIYLYMQSLSDLLASRKSKPATDVDKPLRAIPVTMGAGGNGEE